MSLLGLSPVWFSHSSDRFPVFEKKGIGRVGVADRGPRDVPDGDRSEFLRAAPVGADSSVACDVHR
jgi:hypothetical protein